MLNERSPSLLPKTSLKNYKLSLEPINIQIVEDGTIIGQDSININQSSLSKVTGSLFETRIDADPTATKLVTNPKLQIKDAFISYVLDGRKVTYFLSENEEPEVHNPLISAGEEFL